MSTKRSSDTFILKRFFVDLKRYFPYIKTSAAATLKSGVSGAYLGWLWWILDPLLFMLVYTFISIVVFKQSVRYFPVFVFIGLTTWQFFEKVTKQSVSLLRHNKDIIKKVYVPKHMFLLENICVNAFKFFISSILVVIMMFIYRVPFRLGFWQVIPELILLLLLTFGINLFFMHIGVYIQDLGNLINVALRFVFYLSGVFYDITGRVPEPWNYFLVRVNPVAFVMTSLRGTLLYSEPVDWLWLGIWTAVSLLLIVSGIYLIYRQENSYAKVI